MMVINQSKRLRILFSSPLSVEVSALDKKARFWTWSLCGLDDPPSVVTIYVQQEFKTVRAPLLPGCGFSTACPALLWPASWPNLHFASGVLLLGEEGKVVLLLLGEEGEVVTLGGGEVVTLIVVAGWLGLLVVVSPPTVELGWPTLVDGGLPFPLWVWTPFPLEVVFSADLESPSFRFSPWTKTHQFIPSKI